MRFTFQLRQYQPMIKFIGKRHPAPQKVDHTPHVHPAAPTSDTLPAAASNSSFASYRQKAQQHGPLGGRQFQSSAGPTRSGASLGAVKAEKGEYFDRNELPPRFRRTTFSMDEIEAIESGGASMHA